MNKKKLGFVLEKHSIWINDNPKGERADLRSADLRDADLQGADLWGANLRDADLQGAKNISEFICATASILPEGDIIGWKKCKNDVIIKLLIPKKAKRSNATGRKCRAEYVKILEVIGADVGIGSYDDGKTIYEVGKTVKADSWDEERWVECSHGIHFFITRYEAEQYQ
jgi:hypothetical protein